MIQLRTIRRSSIASSDDFYPDACQGRARRAGYYCARKRPLPAGLLGTYDSSTPTTFLRGSCRSILASRESQTRRLCRSGWPSPLLSSTATVKALADCFSIPLNRIRQRNNTERGGSVTASEWDMPWEGTALVGSPLAQENPSTSCEPIPASTRLTNSIGRSQAIQGGSASLTMNPVLSRRARGALR